MTWVLNSTRIKQTFLRPTSDNGVSAPRWHTGFRRFCVTAVWGFLSLAAIDCEAAFVPAPKAAVKALKITRGKPFDTGVVFIDGKYIAPPYTVERYGNVIRINGVQATNPVVDWAEFLKTQSGVTVTKVEAAPAAATETPPTVAETAPQPSDSADGDDPLSDLFDDTPATPAKTAKAAGPAAAAKPSVTTTVKLNGAFEMNDRAKGLVGKVNLMRRDIDAALRRGGFFCFGSGYSRVSGDRTLSAKIMAEIPLVMKNHSEYPDFAAAVRSAGFVYFPPRLVRDLHANRLDYPALQKRYRKMQDDAALREMIDRTESSSF